MLGRKKFKSLLDDFVSATKNDLTDRKIEQSRDVLVGLMLQYVENLAGHTQDQKKYVDGLWQKTTNFSVENKELMSKRCLEIASLAYMMYEELNKDE